MISSYECSTAGVSSIGLGKLDSKSPLGHLNREMVAGLGGLQPLSPKPEVAECQS